MKNAILLISSLIIFQSCGGGVSDRSVSATSTGGNGSNLSPTQIESLAKLKIYEDLEELGLIDYYADAKARYPSKSFDQLEDFSLVVCSNSIHGSIVNKYKSYGALVAEVSNLLVHLEEEYNFEHENNELSVDELVIIISALNKLADYNTLLFLHSQKCLSVKLIEPEEAEEEEQAPEGPSPTPED